MECETLLRVTLAGFERVLDPSESMIGEMLSDIATLLDDRATWRKPSPLACAPLSTFSTTRDPTACYTNVERLVQAQRLISDERQTQAAELLDAVQSSLEVRSDADDDD